MVNLADLDGTSWEGTAELWLDPLGDKVVRSGCRVSVSDDGLKYAWSHEGTNHEGSVEVGKDGAQFVDSWHQPEAMTCLHVSNAPGLIQVQGEYGPQLDWGWRITLSLREPTGELVLQMTNIAPWGEEARAVRMTCRRS